MRDKIHQFILTIAKVWPESRLQEFRDCLMELGYNVSRFYICVKLRDFGLSYKIPCVFHQKRYTIENFHRYVDYFNYIKHIDPRKLKFVDEASCMSRNLRRKYILSNIGERSYDINPEKLDKTISVLLMTSISKPEDQLPIVFHLREDTNKDVDYLEFVRFLIEQGHLSNGDILFADNATIHSSTETLPELLHLLVEAGVCYFFLPPYSPDCNPCENVFAMLKHYLRWHRGIEKFYIEIIKGLILVNHKTMVNFYHHCLNR